MRVPVAGTWLRHIPAGGAALYRPPTPADGRWQRGAAVEGIYLAAEEATAWAEWYRWLAELEIEPLRGLPRELWSYRTNLRSVADLTSAEALAALDLPTAEPMRAQWPAFQDVGERLHAAGCEGVLYRSAARPGGLCLCVFRATPADVVERLEPLPPPRRVTRPPAPPRGLRT
jgi:RES domain-containing protein